MGFWDWFSSKCCVDDGDDVVGEPGNVQEMKSRLEGKLKKYLEYRVGDYLNNEIYKVEKGWSKRKKQDYINEVQNVYLVHENHKQISNIPEMDIKYWNRVYESFMRIAVHKDDNAVSDIDGYRVVKNKKRKCLWCHESAALIHNEILKSGYQGKYEIVECGLASGSSGHWIVVLGRKKSDWDNIFLADNDVVVDIWGRLSGRYYKGIESKSVIFTGKEARRWKGKKNVRTRVIGGTDVKRSAKEARTLSKIERFMLQKRERQLKGLDDFEPKKKPREKHVRKQEVIEIKRPVRTGYQYGRRQRVTRNHRQHRHMNNTHLTMLEEAIRNRSRRTYY